MVNIMIHNKDILNSLPLLASVLGRNYGVTVQIGGDSAYTNGNEIHIPSLPLDCDEEMIGLARGYIDHESAHIRFTDFEALKKAELDPVTHHIWNSIEDWRVEEKLSAFYPGCRQHFHWLARKIFVEYTDKRQEEAGDKPASSILEYVLLSVRSWSVPEITDPLRRVRTQIDTHFQGLRKSIDRVLIRMQNTCHSTEDAISYAREIAAIMKRWEPEKQPLQRSEKNGGLMGTSGAEKSKTIDESSIKETKEEEGSNRQIPYGSPECPTDETYESSCEEEKQSSSDTSNTKQCEEEDHVCTATQRSLLGDHQEDAEFDAKSQMTCQTKQTQEEKGNNPVQDIADLFASQESDLPRSLENQIASILTEGQAAKRDNSISVATVGSVAYCDVTQDEKENALRASIGLRSRLQGLLEAKIKQSTGVGLRGALSTKHLYRLRIGNPRIFASQEERQGLNTAVHLLLDVSSSMSGSAIQLARQACYAVTKALSGIKGINPAVTAFPSEGYADNTVAPLLCHGEKLPPYLSVKANGSTPLAEALWWVMQTMLALRESRKIILILTDGMPNSVPNAKSALDNAKNAGFEVFGIGIVSSSITQLLPKTSQNIYNLTDLAPTMFTILQKALLKGENL